MAESQPVTTETVTGCLCAESLDQRDQTSSHTPTTSPCWPRVLVLLVLPGSLDKENSFLPILVQKNPTFAGRKFPYCMFHECYLIVSYYWGTHYLLSVAVATKVATSYKGALDFTAQSPKNSLERCDILPVQRWTLDRHVFRSYNATVL